MADDYTPTTDEILDGYVTMRSREIPGDRVLASVQALSEAERWLAEHDAAKRVEWEAEQGEVTDVERRRVITDILRYRLLPNEVIESLNGYLEAMDEEEKNRV